MAAYNKIIIIVLKLVQIAAAKFNDFRQIETQTTMLSIDSYIKLKMSHAKVFTQQYFHWKTSQLQLVIIILLLLPQVLI